MDNETREELIRKFGTAGINVYVHLNCEEAALEKVRREGKVVQPERVSSWDARSLIGRYRDIDRCDQCGVLFPESDDGYKSFWVTTPAELASWKKINRRKRWWQFWR